MNELRDLANGGRVRPVLAMLSRRLCMLPEGTGLAGAIVFVKADKSSSSSRSAAAFGLRKSSSACHR